MIQHLPKQSLHSLIKTIGLGPKVRPQKKQKLGSKNYYEKYPCRGENRFHKQCANAFNIVAHLPWH